MSNVIVLRPERIVSRRRVVMDVEQAEATLGGARALERLVDMARRNGFREDDAHAALMQHAIELRTLARQFFLAAADDEGVVS